MAIRHSSTFGPGAFLTVRPGVGTVRSIANVPATLARPFSIAKAPFQSDLYIVGTDGRRPGGGVTTCDVFATAIRQDTMFTSTRLNAQPLDEETIVGVAIIGDRVLALGRSHLLSIPLNGGQTQTLHTFAPGSPGEAMVADGRDAYVAINLRDILRFDLLRPNDPPTLFATVPGAFLNAVLDLELGGDDDLWVGTGDPITGGELLSYRRGDGQLLTRTGALSPAVGSLSYDGKTDTFTLATSVGARYGFRTFDGTTVQAPFALTASDIVATAIQRTPALLEAGSFCTTADGGEPRLRARGYPSLGNAGFRVELASIPNELTCVLIGVRSGLTEFPSFDLGPLGAPGCTAYVPIDSAICAATSQAGIASWSLPVPPNPGLAGLVIDLQGVVFDPPANSRGIAMTRRGTVILSR